MESREEEGEAGVPQEACPPATSMHRRGAILPHSSGMKELHQRRAASHSGGSPTSAPHQETLWGCARSLSLSLYSGGLSSLSENSQFAQRSG